MSYSHLMKFREDYMKTLIKPQKLCPGDTIAAISPSCGLASVFPHQYQWGKKQIEENFNVKVIETPHALESMDFLYEHPEIRAQDLMWAFKNPDVKAIFSIIGGDDSIRLLPYLDLDVIKNNPKIFLGYSDPTSVHMMCYKAGLSSIYGPTIMSGFGENCGLFDYTIKATKRTLFQNEVLGEIEPSKMGWTDEFLDWANPENLKIKRRLHPYSGPKYVQGNGIVRGRLIGGCFEVLLMMTGTELFPDVHDFEGAIMFLEVSEDTPPENMLLYWLRSLAAQGIINKLSGFILGRAKNSINNMSVYENALLKVTKECNRSDMPIVTQMDFGHTDPMFYLPYGALAEIDVQNQRFSILESAVI